jgi:cytochrome c-type biogenesis protein
VLAYAFSFLAGILTTLSPCVLPVLPLLVGSAVQEHRYAPLAVAGGMTLSFAALGVFFSTVGITLGIDAETVRSIAAAVVIAFGIVMIIPGLQERLTGLFTPLANAASAKVGSGKFAGLSGHFFLGALLGAVWSPCVGPTLGATVGLASEKGGILPATAMMLLFGAGASTPLLFIAYGSRRLFLTNRGKLLRIGQIMKPVMGGILIVTGTLILTRYDRMIEAKILNSLPPAWIDLVTRF